jgi:hypothetical protein
MAKPDLPEGSAYYPQSVVAKKQMLFFRGGSRMLSASYTISPFLLSDVYNA